MVVTCVFRHNSRCEKPAEPPRFVASNALRRHPRGKPATACCNGPSVGFTTPLYQQQTGLLQAARTWCQLLRVRVAAVSSVCVLPRHRCRDSGWDRGWRTRLNSARCNTQELRCSLVSASRWSCAVVRTGCQPKIRAPLAQEQHRALNRFRFTGSTLLKHLSFNVLAMMIKRTCQELIIT